MLVGLNVHTSVYASCNIAHSDACLIEHDHTVAHFKKNVIYKTVDYFFLYIYTSKEVLLTMEKFLNQK